MTMALPLAPQDPGRRALMTGSALDGQLRAQGPFYMKEPFDPIASERRSRQALLARLAPNVQVVDQEGRKLRFYDDVLKGQHVVLSAMYSACEQSCPPTMRNLLEARQLLGAEARTLRFVTMTLTPVSDDPRSLVAYKRRYNLPSDWLLLTGDPSEMERLQAALGYSPQRISDTALTHASMVRVCNERLMRWGHVNGLSSPRNIARMIRFEMA